MSPSDASLPKNSATHNQRIGQGSCISRSFLGLKLCTSGVSFTGVSWEFFSVSLSIFCCFYTQSMTHTLLSSSQDMGPWDSAAPTMFLSRRPPSSLTQAQRSRKKACQRRAIACCGNTIKNKSPPKSEWIRSKELVLCHPFNLLQASTKPGRDHAKSLKNFDKIHKSFLPFLWFHPEFFHGQEDTKPDSYPIQAANYFGLSKSRLFPLILMLTGNTARRRHNFVTFSHHFGLWSVWGQGNRLPSHSKCMQLHLQCPNHLEETEEAIDACRPTFDGTGEIETQPASRQKTRQSMFGL